MFAQQPSIYATYPVCQAQYKVLGRVLSKVEAPPHPAALTPACPRAYDAEKDINLDQTHIMHAGQCVVTDQSLFLKGKEHDSRKV